MNTIRQWMRILSASCTLVALASSAIAGEGKIRRSPHAVKDEYIVFLDDRTKPDQVPAIARNLARQHGGRVNKMWGHAIKGFFVTMTEARARAMSHHPDVAYVEENAEMFLSAATNVDPSCIPGPGVSCQTTDNRLWHLDVMDQNAAVGTKTYSYCPDSDGSNVYVYVIDTGVMRAHREFNGDANRVLAGYDATGDPSWFPAWDPCHGAVNDEMTEPGWVAEMSHGTGVASLVSGLNVGVARDAKIVPVKTAPCGKAGARNLIQGRPYALNEIVRANGWFYRVESAGIAGNPQVVFPWCAEESPPGCLTTVGDVRLEFHAKLLPLTQTVQMIIDGLDWIVRPSQPDENGNYPPGGPGSPYPKSPAVVTLSTYQVVGQAGVTSLEQAITNLLNYSGGGITVVASANNQGANACDTSPARMSVGNLPRVITVGGTMLRNNPDSLQIDPPMIGASELVFNPAKPTVFARWRCHGAPVDCENHNPPNSADVDAIPPPTPPNPSTNATGYSRTQLGSNGGACVTLFAPAMGIPVASSVSTDAYRNPRVPGGKASGTSWSAPIVAGMAARILESHPTYTANEVRNALLAHTRPVLDTLHLNPPNVTGTTNLVLQMTDVSVNDLPATIQAAASGPTYITAAASGASTLSYQLFEVDAAFDVNASRRNAHTFTEVAPAQASNTFAVSPSIDTLYFVRVKSTCGGSADTSITTVTASAPPAAPSNFTATRNGASVSFNWSTVASADGYRVDQKLPGVAWTMSTMISGGSTTSASAAAPSTPGGVVLYRVLATRGSAISSPSIADVAWVGTLADDPAATASTMIHGIHLIELRRAVNALCDAAGLSQQYSAAETAGNALGGMLVDDAHFTDLMTRLNAARTNATIGMSAMLFSTPMSSNRLVSASDINELRDGLK